MKQLRIFVSSLIDKASKPGCKEVWIEEVEVEVEAVEISGLPGNDVDDDELIETEDEAEDEAEEAEDEEEEAGKITDDREEDEVELELE